MAKSQVKIQQTAGRDALGEFAPEFAHLNDDILFGEVWSRNDLLSLRDRSIVTVVSLMSQGLTDSSFKYHLESAKKNGVTSGIPEIFEGFQPKQFFIVLGMLIAYLICMYFVGFYLATIVLMAASLLYLRVPKWQILISTIVIIGLVYGAFTMFLGVKLPVGLLFK